MLQNVEEGDPSSKVSVSSTISRLKKHVQSERQAYVKEKMEVNSANLQIYCSDLFELCSSQVAANDQQENDMLNIRIQKALNKFGDPDNEGSSPRDDSSAPIVVGSTSGSKSVVKPVKLPAVQRAPPYTTWIFLDRNQRMADDQSVVGRRRIYYDTAGNEALICSDSEEEQIEEDEDKRDFSTADDFLIWTTLQDHGITKPSLKSIADCIDAKTSEVEARYEVLLKEAETKGGQLNKDKIADMHADAKKEINLADDKFRAKDLTSAMDSLDKLFCRRCLVFDCRLHGCSQHLVLPVEKQDPCSKLETPVTAPCGPSCFRLSTQRGLLSTDADLKILIPGANKSQTEEGSQPADVDQAEPLDLTKKIVKDRQVNALRKLLKRKSGKLVTEDGASEAARKKQQHEKSGDEEAAKTPTESNNTCHMDWEKSSKKIMSQRIVKKSTLITKAKRHSAAGEGSSTAATNQKILQRTLSKKRKILGNILHHTSERRESTENEEEDNLRNWNALEKGLYDKGIEIFGTDSCRIARNLLQGLKSCEEVGELMRAEAAAKMKLLRRKSEEQIDAYEKNLEIGSSKSKAYNGRRKGRVRRLKYSWKSVGHHHSVRKRRKDGKDGCRQYTPCSCVGPCGKQCPCLRSGTCCEKYCGCLKGCKNRFRGCHCAKSQCSSRQCPCFAGGRECDPDVCRNCWVGCGDGTLGGPNQEGDNYECRNMKLLLKQQQRVLLGRSDVAGWGAFLKGPVNKHEYLGEYTGELISHREADKRGKIYDRENSSFLFNLNDQYVLDACRKGDKLKFANHSPSPNCYAKVIMVAGDHRVGIFAKERIAAGEELFYDYRYEIDRAPAWARKPEDCNNKNDESANASGRAQKTAQH